MADYFEWFGICTIGTNICEYQDTKKLLSLHSGELIKISPHFMSQDESMITLFNQQKPIKSGGQIVKIFLCPNTKFDTVNDDFWPYLIVETNCASRLNVFRKQQEILSFKVGDIKNICMNFDKLYREQNIRCRIEYIGEVPEYGEGINFCLCALERTFEFAKNPQMNFIGKYAKDSSTSLIIVTASAFFEAIEFVNIINRPVVVVNKEIPGDEIKQLQIQFKEIKQRLVIGNVEDFPVQKNTGVIRKNSLEKIKSPEKISLIFNSISMVCFICRKDCPASSGILLSNCGHMFCYECLISHVNLTSGDMKICPFINKKYRCNSIIQMNEIVCLNSEGTKTLIEKNRNKPTLVNTNISWSCFKCTYENNLNATKCNICDAERVFLSVNCIQCMNCFDTCSHGTIFNTEECNHNVCNNCLMVYLEYQLKNDVDSVNCPIKFCDYILKPRQILEMFIQLDRFYIKDGMNFFDICIACQVRHSKVSCKEFQQTLKNRSGQFWEDLRGKYDKLFDNGDAAYCPKCQLIIVKQGHEKEYCLNCKEVFKPDYQENAWQCGICFNSNNRSSNICGVCGKIPKNKVANKTAIANCMFCTLEIKFTDGMTLSCSHFFCKACLQFVVNSNEPVVRCPFPHNNKTCSATIEQYEILQIMGPEMYKRYKVRLARNVAKHTENSVLCLDENCIGWTFKEDLNDTNMFICTVCRQPNCLVCKVVHVGMTCAAYNREKHDKCVNPQRQQHKDLLKMDDDSMMKIIIPCQMVNCIGFFENDGTINEQECSICKAINCFNCSAIHTGISCDEYRTSKTDKILQEEIARGNGMQCPKCNIFIGRCGSGDWLQCIICKTEICWPTKGARWGPNGHGDIMGGCRCLVDNGQKCHPTCMNC